jgi:hypothetical protein
VGNILEQPLLGVVESSMRRALIDRPCSRVCAYHQQNEVLLALERAARSGGQDRTRGPEEVVPATVRPKDKFSRQDYFI